MEFVVPSDKIDILLRSSNYISTLFNVQFSVQREVVNGKQWVKICSRQDRREDLQKAKEYIEALCCPAITIEAIPNDTRVTQNLDTISKTYGVVANADRNNIKLRGSQFNVALAKSWIEGEDEAKPSSRTNATTEAASSIQTCKKFATKLGYSETDIEVVAETLAPGPVDTNTFLQELIYRARPKTTTATTLSKTVSDKRRTDVVPRGISARSMPYESERTIERQRRRFENVQPDGHCSNQDVCPIIIDGSNVAMHHGNHKVFSCRGICLCVDWFKKRGCTEVYVLVPRYRAEAPRQGYPIQDQHLLIELEKTGVVKFTPSRRNDNGRDIVCYDDRFILESAHELEGVIVSNDEYRDLKRENAVWKHIIEKRVLMFSFVRDLFMVPEDPLGRKGPSLNEFLKRRTNGMHRRICPWFASGNCTFGSKCRYDHPDRVQDNRENREARQGYQRQQHAQQQPSLQQDHHHLSPQEYLYDLHMQHLQENHQQQQQLPQLGHRQQDHQQMSSSFASVYSMPRQYSYTPPNSFGYNNSSSNQQTLFTELTDMFPDIDVQYIKLLLEENTERQNIDKLIDKLLQV